MAFSINLSEEVDCEVRLFFFHRIPPRQPSTLEDFLIGIEAMRHNVYYNCLCLSGTPGAFALYALASSGRLRIILIVETDEVVSIQHLWGESHHAIYTAVFVGGEEHAQRTVCHIRFGDGQCHTHADAVVCTQVDILAFQVVPV